MITSKTRNLGLAALLSAAALRAGQDPAPPPASAGVRAVLPDPDADALVSEALAKNPDVAAATATSEAAGFRIAPARTLPDPFLSFNYENDGWAPSLGEREMTLLGAMFAQPLPWPGKLRLAGQETALRAEGVEAGTVGRARLSVEARLRRAFVDYLRARAELELIGDRERAWRDILSVARDRYAAGIGVQQDVLRAQAEILRLDEARADQSAQVANRRSEVNRMAGRPEESPLEAARRLELRLDIPELAALLAAVRERSPELAALSRGIEADRSRVALAKKDLLPDFVASGGLMYRGSLDPMWQVGLGITLPVYSRSRQKPRMAAANAELRSTESRYASTTLELEFRTRERFRNVEAALQVARLYRDGVLPVDQLSLESALASYRAGKVPFITVLDALNALSADRSVYVGRLAEAEKWRVAIDEGEVQAADAMAASPARSSAPETSGMSDAKGTMR